MMLAVLILFGAYASVRAQEVQPSSPDGRQSQSDAWWTGPMLANSAATLPRGHFLLEPYLYDAIADHNFDGNGARRRAARSNGFGSLTYILYGLTDRVAVGLIPTAGFVAVSDGPNSSGVGLGDAGLLAQYRLTQVRAGSSMPTVSIAVQETFPTGRFDRLGDHPSDGVGAGAYTTALSLYTQTYFWLPNGRILRMRVNGTQAFSSAVQVEDVSVYGTGPDFRGRAMPGSSSFVDASWEYSATRRWVIATDVTYRRARTTRVTGYGAADSNVGGIPPSVTVDSGASDAWGVAPAIEFNWTSRIGVLVGARVMVAGRNTSASITPAVAINVVH